MLFAQAAVCDQNIPLDTNMELSRSEVLITSIAIDRSIAKALWVDRTAIKKIKFKRILNHLADTI